MFPFVARRSDGFRSVVLSANTPIEPTAQRSAELFRIEQGDEEGTEWSIITYVRPTVPRRRGQSHERVRLRGALQFGFGSMQTGEDVEFDWRHGLSLRVAGTAAILRCEYLLAGRENAGYPLMVVGASCVPGGSPTRGEVTRTDFSDELFVDGASVVLPIPRRASRLRLALPAPLDYGRYGVEFLTAPAGGTVLVGWVPTSPSDEIPVPADAMDYRVFRLVAGDFAADAQFVLEL